MRKTLSLLTILLFGIHAIAQEKADLKPSFNVQINGKTYTLVDGEELQLDTTLVNPLITVSLNEYITFKDGPVSFDYPNNFSSTYEKDIGYQNWTMDGDNFVIMYFVIDAVAGLDDFVGEMINIFGKKNCKTEKTKLKLGDQTLKGKRINVELIGQNLTLDFLEIKSTDGKTRFISFQDSLDEAGKATAECIATLEVINNSIKYE